MTKPRIKTISDAVLADTLMEMKEDYGTWDMDPAVQELTRKDFNILSSKMVKGVREVSRRVDRDGLEAHEPLSRIFKATVGLVRKGDYDAWEVYDALRRVSRKKSPQQKYAF